MANDFLTISELEKRTLKELYQEARKFQIPYYGQMNKKELTLAIMNAQASENGFVQIAGVLDIMQDGYGFLRPINYASSKEDVYVAASQIRRFSLRNGDFIEGTARPPHENEKFAGLMQVNRINGKNVELAKERPHFPALTPIYPQQQMKLETGTQPLSTRVIDMAAPIGFGQRGLIVAPPKAGKTEMIKAIANGITTNYPDVDLMVVLIDERPEEVTDIERSVQGEVISSTFDQQPQHHVKVADLVLDHAMRLVEDKRDVVILLDSITRLARANNLVIPPSGRTLSGGLDPASLYRPKKFFGAARNIEEGGSLTIIATALVETGSRMDDMIYEEFKGTGNMELHLSRELAERRIYPAVDVKRSGTRRDDLLLSSEQQEVLWQWRQQFAHETVKAAGQWLQQLSQTKNNAEWYKKQQKN